VGSRLWSSRRWRWFSPATFVAAAAAFCLPWLDIRCNYTTAREQQSVTVVRQTGSQAALGGRFTADPARLDATFPGAGLLRGLYETREDDDALRGASPAAQLAAAYHGQTTRKSVALQGQQGALARAREQAAMSCWLVAAYGVLVEVGIVGGVLLPAGRRRATLLAGIGGACAAVLAAQTSAGYPVQVWVTAENAALRAVHEEYAPNSFTRGPPELVLSHTWIYTLAFALPGIVVVAAVAEWVAFRRPTTATQPSAGP
jgi:hypothetical protein